MLLIRSHVVKDLALGKFSSLVVVLDSFTFTQFHAWPEHATDDASEKRCQPNGFTQESVQERVEHAVCQHNKPEGIIYHPMNILLRVVAQLVKKINPIWQSANEENCH